MLTIVRGLPGAGKSTYAKSLNGLHLEADMFFVGPDGQYKFNPAVKGQAHNWCQNKVREAISKKQDVIVSNTFTALWEMKPYFDMAKEYDTEVKVIHVKGGFKSVHNIPEPILEKMRARWEPYPGEKVITPEIKKSFLMVKRVMAKFTREELNLGNPRDWKVPGKRMSPESRPDIPPATRVHKPETQYDRNRTKNQFREDLKNIEWN